MSIDDKIIGDFHTNLAKFKAREGKGQEYYFESSEYRALVGMGLKILHLVRERYCRSLDEDGLPIPFFWSGVIFDILRTTGFDAPTPECVKGNPEAIRAYALGALDHYLSTASCSIKLCFSPDTSKKAIHEYLTALRENLTKVGAEFTIEPSNLEGTLFTLKNHHLLT